MGRKIQRTPEEHKEYVQRKTDEELARAREQLAVRDPPILVSTRAAGAFLDCSTKTLLRDRGSQPSRWGGCSMSPADNEDNTGALNQHIKYDLSCLVNRMKAAIKRKDDSYKRKEAEEKTYPSRPSMVGAIMSFKTLADVLCDEEPWVLDDAGRIEMHAYLATDSELGAALDEDRYIECSLADALEHASWTDLDEQEAYNKVFKSAVETTHIMNANRIVNARLERGLD